MRTTKRLPSGARFEISREARRCKAPLSPNPRLIGQKRTLYHGIGDHHYFEVILSAEVQLVPVGRPDRLHTVAARDISTCGRCPETARTRNPRLMPPVVREVRKPPSVGREGRPAFVEPCSQERLWLSCPQLCAIALQWHGPDVEPGYQEFSSPEREAVCRRAVKRRSGTARFPLLGQRLRLRRTVSARPEHASRRLEHDVVAIGESSEGRCTIPRQK